MNHTSRFIANADLWEKLHTLAKTSSRVRAAIAYFGKAGPALLPLKRDDCLIVDLSLAAVRQGVTNPKALQKLARRGVKLFSRASLHAKFVIAGHTVIASSANASTNSSSVLDEAGIITNDPAAVKRAIDFFDKLCTEPVGREYLAKCVKEYKPPRFKAAIERHAPKARSTRRVREAKLWFIGGLRELILRDIERESIEKVEAKVAKKLSTPESTEVRWIRYARKPKGLRWLREGDWVVDCTHDGNAREVGPPARLLSEEQWVSDRGKKYVLLMLESPKNGEPMPLSLFRRKLRTFEPSLDQPSPRTRPIPNVEHADRVLRLWTARGKVAK